MSYPELNMSDCGWSQSIDSVNPERLVPLWEMLYECL